MTFGQRCTATTKNGQQCQAYAVRRSSPPLCSVHLKKNEGAGAPVGNQNARKHGFYGSQFSAEELSDLVEQAQDRTLGDEIALARVVLRRLMKFLDSDGGDEGVSLEQVRAIAPVALAGTRTVARLLKDAQALSKGTGDGVSDAIAAALDELGDEWGVKL